MDFTALLDVMIGLSLVYLGAALFVTIFNEYLAQLFSLRAKVLCADLKKLIDGDDVRNVLAENPALAPFFSEGGKGGSYVDTNVLARHLVGGLRAGAWAVATMPEVIAGINAMTDSKLKTQLQALAQAGSGTVDKFVDSVSVWVDRSLTMMGEEFKKQTQRNSLVIGFFIAFCLNLDSLGIATRLYHDKEAREAVAKVASDLVQKTSEEKFKKCSALTLEKMKAESDCTSVAWLVQGVQHRNDTFGKLPLGWTGGHPFGPDFPWPWTAPLAWLGWLLTALAISLGASFWFDLLNKLVNIRHGMRRPQPETANEKPA